MPITLHAASWCDVEEGLGIQPRNRGDASIGIDAALHVWKRLFRHPFFAAVCLETSPPIQGHRVIGLGAAVFLAGSFADVEVGHPRPDINSRVMAGVHAGHPVLAERNEVARANAGRGVDVLILQPSCWLDGVLDQGQRELVQNLLPSSFAEWIAGHRVHRIIAETADEPSKEHLRHSIVFQAIAEFPALGRTLHTMTRESITVVSAHLGNMIFSYREPVLELRDSDQQLLRLALSGATDEELAGQLGVTFAAVKARWRSTFARVDARMPGLVSSAEDHEGRGAQKRHRVMAYVRSHPEELQPYDWQRNGRRPAGSVKNWMSERTRPVQL
jgi:hypothetical protein